MTNQKDATQEDLDNLFLLMFAQALKSSIRPGEKSDRLFCPLCGAQLVYGASANGHLMARCRTPECLNLME